MDFYPSRHNNPPLLKADHCSCVKCKKVKIKCKHCAVENPIMHCTIPKKDLNTLCEHFNNEHMRESGDMQIRHARKFKSMHDDSSRYFQHHADTRSRFNKSIHNPRDFGDPHPRLCSKHYSYDEEGSESPDSNENGNRSLPTPNRHQNKVRASKAQTSRSYLNMIRVVERMKPVWEEMVAEEQINAQRNKYCPGSKHFHCEKCLNYRKSSRRSHSRRRRRYPKNDEYIPNKTTIDYHMSTRVGSRSNLEENRQEHKRHTKSFQEDHEELEPQYFHIPSPMQAKQKLHTHSYHKHDQRESYNPSGSDEHETGSSDWSDSDDLEEDKRSAGKVRHSTSNSNEKLRNENIKAEGRHESKYSSFEEQKFDIDKSSEASPSKYDYQSKRRIFSQERETEKNTNHPIKKATDKGHVYRHVQNIELGEHDSPGHSYSKPENREPFEERSEKLRKSTQEKDTFEYSHLRNVSTTTNRSHVIRTQRISQSEGAKRTPGHKPTLSKFSQTQAELELDFHRLNRNNTRTESKSSQTETKYEVDDKVKIENIHSSWETAAQTKQRTSKSFETDPRLQNPDISTKDVKSGEEFLTPRNSARKEYEHSHRNSASVPSKSKETMTSVPARPSKSDFVAHSTNQGEGQIQGHSPLSPEHPHKQHRRDKLVKPTVPRGDGLKVLRHSRSMSCAKCCENPKNLQTTTTRSGKSISSAPPGTDLNSPPAGNSNSSDSWALVTESESSSFAMEHAATGEYPDEALRQLSEYYDSLVISEPVIQSVEIQDSYIVKNESLTQIRQASIPNLEVERTTPIIRGISGNEHKFIWRGPSLGGDDNEKQIEAQAEKICTHCHREIQSEEILDSKSLGLSWHPNCFRCSVCSVVLNPSNHFVFEKQILCASHFAEKIKVPICSFCKEYILEDSYTKARGRTWHSYHFKCDCCSEKIMDSKYVFNHGKVLCLECHKRLLPKKCTSCGLRIKTNQQFVQSGNEFWHARESCFHCFTCRKSLVDRRRMFERNGMTYCNRYCALRNSPPA